MITD
ncbi:hypothetical protein VCHENC02_5354A, partial [Vibrio harveyi]